MPPAFWRPKPSPPPPTALESFAATEDRTFVSEAGPPMWLTRLTPKTALSTTASQVALPDLRDTILIGCGPAGRVVLSQVVLALQADYGRSLPANIRLIQIDAQLKGVDARPSVMTPIIEGVNQIVLQADPVEVEANLRVRPRDWQHLDWYDGTAPFYERARGRLALFYDLRNGSAHSTLWPTFQRALASLSTPIVRVIGTTFDDTASGILVDIARLIHIISRRPIDVELWLAAPVGQEWSHRLNDPRRRVRPDDQRSRSLATLRELERFQRNSEAPFVYAPASSKQSELRGAAGGVVQTLILFESRAGAAPEDDVLACMADSLVALLHPDAAKALTQHMAANRTVAGSKINDSSLGMTLGIGCYAFRLPSEAVSKALAWRMVRDLLFDKAVGLLPREVCRSDGSHDRIPVSQVDSSIDVPALRHEADLLVHRFVSSKVGLDTAGFLATVVKNAGVLLNGEGTSEAIKGRNNGLRRARVWSEFLRSAVVREGERRLAAQITQLIDKLQRWELWIDQAVYPACQDHMRRSREELDHLRQQKGRNWVLDEQLEWPIYRQHVRSWTHTPTEDSDPLLRAGGRFGWELAFQLDPFAWTLHLLAPPPDFVWEQRADLDAYAVDADMAPENLLDRLMRVAEPFCRLSRKTSLTTSRATSFDPATWLEQGNARIAFNESEATREMGQISQSYLLSGPGGLEQIRASFEKSGARISQCQSPTNETVALLHFIDWVPLSLTSQFDDEAWQSQPVLPQMHVWRPEQIAASIEQEQRLSARFVEWLARDAELVEWLAQSYLYDVINHTPDGWSLPGGVLIPERSIGRAVESLIVSPPPTVRNNRARILAELQSAVAQQQQAQLGQRLAFLRHARETRIRPLLDSPDGRDRDLGIYLLGLAATTRR